MMCGTQNRGIVDLPPHPFISQVRPVGTSMYCVYTYWNGIDALLECTILKKKKKKVVYRTCRNFQV